MSNDIFVVHGRNKAAKDAMFAFLRALGLRPLSWSQAMSLTGKATPSTIEIVRSGINSAQCTVILLTGDDVATLRPEFGLSAPLYQPRPNVIFEAGWALAVSGESKTILVGFEALRGFSDIDGLTITSLDDSPETRNDFVERLRAAGCNPDTTNSDYLKPEITGCFAISLSETVDITTLRRGGFTDFIVDSSISYSLNTLDLYKEAENYVQHGDRANLRYAYLGASGANNWLSLSNDPTYEHARLIDFYKLYTSEIIISAGLTSRKVDFISLGCGDGEIDAHIIY